MKNRAFSDFLESGALVFLNDNRSVAAIPAVYGASMDIFRKQARKAGYKTRLNYDGRVIISKKQAPLE